MNSVFYNLLTSFSISKICPTRFLIRIIFYASLSLLYFDSAAANYTSTRTKNKHGQIKEMFDGSWHRKCQCYGKQIILHQLPVSFCPPSFFCYLVKDELCFFSFLRSMFIAIIVVIFLHLAFLFLYIYILTRFGIQYDTSSRLADRLPLSRLKLSHRSRIFMNFHIHFLSCFLWIKAKR